MQTSVGTDDSNHARKDAGLLEISGVTVRFGGICAVDSVDLTVDRGCCGLIGPNGAGKTTLLDVLSGLRAPTSGRVCLGGVDVTSRSATWLARNGVRRTFQRHQAFGRLTVEENLYVALEWRGRSRHIVSDLLSTRGARRRVSAMSTRINDVIATCGLSDVRHSRAATLPIGRLRLMEFARAIVDEPKLLLLDEPTSGLGQADTDRLGEVIADVTSSGGCCAVLVEHDLDFVNRVCDRLVVLELGSVIADGVPAAVCRDPRVVAAYIGDH